MRTVLMGIGAALCLARSVLAQSEANDRLQTILDEAFSPLLSDAGPGCVYGAAQGGRVLAEGATGLANMEHGIPLSTESVFDIGSTSKQFTAISAAMLALEGKLDLDADIRTYLPEMQVFETPILVKHLIHHSSGLHDPYDPLSWLFGDVYGAFYPSDFTLRMGYGMTSLKSKPGDVYEYSNLGYLLLGQIVERVSGQTLRTFAEDRIFGPLGMSKTHFHDDYREVVPGRASAYQPKADGSGWIWTQSNFTVMGDGGVYSTLGDLAKWYQVFSDPSLLPGGQKLMDLVLTGGEYAKTGATYGPFDVDYGFGVMKMTVDGVDIIGHPGAWAGYITVPFYIKPADISLITICNTRKREVMRAHFGAIPKVAAAVQGADQP